MAGAGLGLARLRHLGQRRALGQSTGDLGGNGFSFGAGEVADQGDHHVAGGIGALVEGNQLFAADARDRLRGAFARMGVGVAAVQALHQFEIGQLAGVLLVHLEAGQQLVLDPCQRVGGEGRLADDLIEQLQRRLAQLGLAQAAQAGDGHVAVGAVAELGAEILEAFGDGADILAGHAFIEHGVGQQGQAGGLAILAAAGGEGQAQVEHRQLGGGDEQHLGAARRLPGLDLQVAAGRRLLVEAAQ